ncbi:NUDIX domain-containing protein [Planktotalea sp.]|uniref:NUDIX domain-containing protein n=1 Tax=Planktotalea sp. TaxID=2029877 RepID=UPI003D6AEB43
MTQSLFFYGSLCHVPLLEIVLGRARSEISIRPAHLQDHLVSWVEGEPFPMIAFEEGARAEGVLVQDLSREDVARLRFYEGGFDYDLTSLRVETSLGLQDADVFFPEAGLWTAGAPWSLEDWVSDWGEISLNAAREVMGHFGRTPAHKMTHLLPFFRARAWAKALAKEGAPTTLRRNTRSEEISVNMRGDGYAGFFRLDTFDIRYPRFDGTQSATLERAAFVAYDAAFVLPYDPERDLIMLVEQLRFGPILRGDPLPWCLEAPAGLVDAGEAPIDTAFRETVEEAGLTLERIEPMLNVYAAPGYSSEYFHCFLGLCNLENVKEGVHGLASENEDIRTHIVSFERAMELLDSGEITVGPTVMMLLWLARKRDEIRSLA